MSIKVEVRLKLEGNETTASAEFEANEIEALRSYHQYAEELFAVKFLRDGARANLNLHYKEGQGMSVNVQLPPEEDVIVFLHKLRPIILNDEHASYNRVTGYIGRRFADPNIRAILRKQREVYDGRRMQEREFRISANGVTINSEEVLSHWLNGYEYHRAQDKKREVDRLHDLLPLEAGRALFLMLLTDKARAIFGIADLVAIILGKTHMVEMSIPRATASPTTVSVSS